MINSVAESKIDLYSLLLSSVKRVYDLKQFGIVKVLGGLQQIRFKSNELSSQSLQRMHSCMLAHVRIFEKPPRPKTSYVSLSMMTLVNLTLD